MKTGGDHIEKKMRYIGQKRTTRKSIFYDKYVV